MSSLQLWPIFNLLQPLRNQQTLLQVANAMDFRLFWSIKAKQLCCPQYLNGTLPSVWCYTTRLSAALKRSMNINLTKVDCETDVNLSPLVCNSRTFLSTRRREFLSLPQDAHPLLSSASTIPLLPGLVARTLQNSVTWNTHLGKILLLSLSGVILAV